MDNFEALSNNELREQLKVHNLGNFPVTDTTRNALIKKLRNALNGPAKPAKGRRETVNVIKHSSAEESAESDAELKKINKPKAVSNRRATIAASAPKPANITNGVVADKVPAKVVPVRSKSPGRKSVPPPEPISYFADASDDDLIAAAEEAEKQNRRKTTRSSRSPSLTKSSVVTTSYKHTIAPLIEHNDDDVLLLNDNSDAEFSSDLLEKIRKPSTPTTKISAPTDNRRKTLQVGPSISTNFASFKPSEQQFDDTSSVKRRYTTYTASTQHNAHGMDDSTDDILNKVEAPFLSDFTRRLAQLKAEKLPGTDLSATYDYKTPKSTTSAYLNEYRSSVYGSNRIGDRFHRDNKTSGTLKQQNPSIVSTWEQKFRWPLIIVLSIFVAVAVYVFLFSNY